MAIRVAGATLVALSVALAVWLSSAKPFDSVDSQWTDLAGWLTVRLVVLGALTAGAWLLISGRLRPNR